VIYVISYIFIIIIYKKYNIERIDIFHQATYYIHHNIQIPFVPRNVALLVLVPKTEKIWKPANWLPFKIPSDKLNSRTW